MYFDKSDIINDIYAKQEDIKKQINKRFKCYFITTKYIKISLRISQIIYVESMNHEIIIHSTTGEIVERKALSQFIKDIDFVNFVQIHKSYVINSWFISQIKNKQIILKKIILFQLERNMRIYQLPSDYCNKLNKIEIKFRNYCEKGIY